MSHWNHRVVRQVHKNDEITHGIHEVIYDDNDKVTGCTLHPITASCETVEELREYVQWMLNCIDKPILEFNEI